MITVKYPIALAAVFIWVGFVCAISFMEAWLKFRAPGITLSLGLGVGKLVFAALNKVEWVLGAVIVFNLLWPGYNKGLELPWYYLLPPVILVLQTLWLLPALDVRAEMTIRGVLTPPSWLHLYYVALEILKVATLLVIGWSFFENNKTTIC